MSVLIILALFLSISRFQLSTHIVQADPGSIQSHAVIIVGGDKNDQSAFNDGFEKAYDALLDCGYTGSGIYHLDVIQTRCSRNRDKEASEENIRKAFTDWLEPRSDNNDICVVFIFAHGNDYDHDSFVLHHPDNTSEVIYYDDVNDWLVNVTYGRLMVVVDACFSQNCIDDLTGEDRIIIATAEFESYTGIGIFSTFFWPRTTEDNIMKSFNNASQEVHDWCIVNPIAPGGTQIPRLDDNGDGRGQRAQLPRFHDGYLANATYLNKNNMTNLVVKTKGKGTEYFTGTDVWIDVEIERSSTVEIILSKNHLHKIEVESNFTYNSMNWNFKHWKDNNSTENPRILVLDQDSEVTAIYTPIVECHMKTNNETGYFYLPNMTLNRIRLDLIWNETLTGDQTGADEILIPYYNLTVWPDKIVDTRDTGFVCRHYGEDEGDDTWHYMADISGLNDIPDRLIDMRDVAVVCRSFGMSGTYRNCTSDDKVYFHAANDTLLNITSPDENGFIEIHPATAYFYVKDQTDNSVGALVTFWKDS